MYVPSDWYGKRGCWIIRHDVQPLHYYDTVTQRQIEIKFIDYKYTEKLLTEKEERRFPTRQAALSDLVKSTHKVIFFSI